MEPDYRRFRRYKSVCTPKNPHLHIICEQQPFSAKGFCVFLIDIFNWISWKCRASNMEFCVNTRLWCQMCIHAWANPHRAFWYFSEYCERFVSYIWGIFMWNMKLNKAWSGQKIYKMSKSTEEMMVQDVEAVIAGKWVSEIQDSDWVLCGPRFPITEMNSFNICAMVC